MFQDSNKEYVGSGAGVAGGNPATPVSLTADQEALIRSVSSAALQKLQQQQAVSNIEAAQAQLNDLARQVVATQQGTLDADALAGQWQQKQQSSPQVITSASSKKSVIPDVKPTIETKTGPLPEARVKNSFAGQVSSPKSIDRPASNYATTVNEPNQGIVEPNQASETSVAKGEEPPETNNTNNLVSSSDTALADKKSEKPGFDADELPSEQDSGGSGLQPDSGDRVSQSDGMGVQAETKPVIGGGAPTQSKSNNPRRSGLRGGLRDLKEGIQNKVVDGGLSFAARGIKDQQKDDATNKKYGDALDIAGDAVKRAQKKRGDGEQLNMGDAKDIAKQAVFDSAKQKVGHHAKEKLAKYIAEHPGELGDMEKLIEGVAGKKVDLSGRQFNKLADKAVQNVAKKGLENVVEKGAQQVVKSGASAIANEAIPLVGSISGTDAVRGVGRGVKQLKDGNVAKAATEVVKGVVKSVIVTIFRLSYEWYVIGLTVGLSLIATAVVGNVLLFLPNRGMTYFEKLLVISIDFLLFFLVIFLLMSIVVMNCSGLTLVGLAVKVASYFSSTANSLNEICKTFNIFNQLAK